MKINIAGNLKRLRKQKGITQEALAEFIGVSFQAVSKWERNEGYPDITILPVIANYFNVTLDELVGMNEIKDQKHLQDVLTIIQQNYVNGKISDNITLLREELKAFPENYQLLSELARSLTMLQTDSDTELKNRKEAVDICERILTYCTDVDIRNHVQANLCFYYDWIGKNDKALEQAQKLPSMWECKDTILPSMIYDDDFVKTSQQSIMQFAGAIRLQLRELADANYIRNLKWSNQERIAILEKGITISSIIFDQEDYLYDNVYLSETYRVMAALALLDKEETRALDFLEKAAKHAVLFDNLPDKAKHTSLLVNQIEHDVMHTSKNFSHNWSYQMLNEYLTQERYNPIRNNSRFVQIENILKEAAK